MKNEVESFLSDLSDLLLTVRPRIFYIKHSARVDLINFTKSLTGQMVQVFFPTFYRLVASSRYRDDNNAML